MDIFDRISRRNLLQHGAAGLLAAGLWPGALRAADAAAEDFSFVVLNDLHYLDKNAIPFHEGVVAKIKEHKAKPEICLIVGDLAENGTKEQFDAVKLLYKELKLPVHVVIGNHDYVKDSDRGPWEMFFPNSLNYTFDHRGWQFVGLDSTAGQAGTAAVGKDTLDWVTANLPKLDTKKPLILFTHFPLGPFVPRRSTNAEQLLAMFKDHNLQAIYNGHFHCLTEVPVNGVTATTNRCCSFSHKNHIGSQEKGFFLCQMKDGKITREIIKAG